MGWSPNEDHVGDPFLTLPQGEPPSDHVLGSKATWGVEPAEKIAADMARWPDVFVRYDGSELVWLDDRGRANVKPVIRSLSESIGRSLLNERRVTFAEKTKTEDGKWAMRRVPPPGPLLERIIATMPGDGWRVLDGLVQAPYMLADGSVVNEAGYRDGLWLSRSAALSLDEVKPPARIMPEGYAPEDAAHAAQLILQDLDGIEWATPGDRSAAFAYFLTLITRPAYRLCPIFLFTAPKSGSGKDLVAKCLENAAHGQEAMRVNPSPGRADEAATELDKRLGAAMRTGEATIVIGDARKIVSPTIYGLTTEARAQGFRVLGESEAIAPPKNLILAAIGNNPELGIDVIRRAVSIRIVPRTSRPEQRTFKLTEEALQALYRDRRAMYLSAAVNIVRGAMRAPTPAMIPCSFAGWSRMVQAACIYAGLPDPLESREALRQRVTADDPASALAQLMGAWWDYRGTMRVTATQACAPLSSTDDGARSYREALMGIDQKLTPQALGRLLASADETSFEVPDSAGELVQVQLRLTRPGNVTHYELRRL
jgi:hypothetical protein